MEAIDRPIYHPPESEDEVGRLRAHPSLGGWAVVASLPGVTHSELVPYRQFSSSRGMDRRVNKAVSRVLRDIDFILDPPSTSNH